MSKDKESICVTVRVRPLSAKEQEEDSRICLRVNESTNLISINGLNGEKQAKDFYYDSVCDKISQHQMFTRVGYKSTEYCMEGYNCTIFAYGQTGAGKTFTMMGVNPEHKDYHDLRGLIPRTLEHLFSYIEKQINELGVEYMIKCSFVEIYNEQIIDLLDSGSNLSIREDLKKGVYIEGVTEEIITRSEEAMEILIKGSKGRHVGSTYYNEASSRSHSVFTMQIESQKISNGVKSTKSRHFHFIDLAGSQRTKKSVGDRLKEGCSINKSLHVLSTVIGSLAEVSEGKARHINYRDSKLTFLLKDSLGGNSKTHLIANISPSWVSSHETRSTLIFARKVKLIKVNKVSINQDSSGNLQSLKTEIKRLKSQLILLKNGKMIPTSDLDQKDTKMVSVLQQYVDEELEKQTQIQIEMNKLIQKNMHLQNGIRQFTENEKQLRMVISIYQDKVLKLKSIENKLLKQIKESQKLESIEEYFRKQRENYRREIESLSKLSNCSSLIKKLMRDLKVNQEQEESDNILAVFSKNNEFLQQIKNSIYELEPQTKQNKMSQKLIKQNEQIKMVNIGLTESIETQSLELAEFRDKLQQTETLLEEAISTQISIEKQLNKQIEERKLRQRERNQYEEKWISGKSELQAIIAQKQELGAIKDKLQEEHQKIKAQNEGIIEQNEREIEKWRNEAIFNRSEREKMKEKMDENEERIKWSEKEKEQLRGELQKLEGEIIKREKQLSEWVSKQKRWEENSLRIEQQLRKSEKQLRDFQEQREKWEENHRELLSMINEKQLGESQTHKKLTQTQLQLMDLNEKLAEITMRNNRKSQNQQQQISQLSIKLKQSEEIRQKQGTQINRLSSLLLESTHKIEQLHNKNEEHRNASSQKYRIKQEELRIAYNQQKNSELQISSLKQALRLKEEELKQLQSKFQNQMEKNQREMQVHLLNKQRIIDERECRIIEMGKQISGYRNSNDELRINCEKLEKSLEEVNRKLLQCQLDNEKVIQNLENDFNEEIDGKNEEIQRLRMEIQEQRVQKQLQRQLLQKERQEKQLSKEQLQLLKEQLLKERQNMQQLRQQKEKKGEQKEQLRQQKEQQRKQMEQLIEQLQIERKLKEKERQQLLNQKDQLFNRVDKMQKERDQLLNEKDQLFNQVDKMENQREQLLNKVNKIQQQRDEKEIERQQMQNLQQQKQDKIIEMTNNYKQLETNCAKLEQKLLISDQNLKAIEKQMGMRQMDVQQKNRIIEKFQVDVNLLNKEMKQILVNRFDKESEIKQFYTEMEAKWNKERKDMESYLNKLKQEKQEVERVLGEQKLKTIRVNSQLQKMLSMNAHETQGNAHETQENAHETQENEGNQSQFVPKFHQIIITKNNLANENKHLREQISSLSTRLQITQQQNIQHDCLLKDKDDEMKKMEEQKCKQIQKLNEVVKQVLKQIERVKEYDGVEIMAMRVRIQQLEKQLRYGDELKSRGEAEVLFVREQNQKLIDEIQRKERVVEELRFNKEKMLGQFSEVRVENERKLRESEKNCIILDQRLSALKSELKEMNDEAAFGKKRAESLENEVKLSNERGQKFRKQLQREKQSNRQFKQLLENAHCQIQNFKLESQDKDRLYHQLLEKVSRNDVERKGLMTQDRKISDLLQKSRIEVSEYRKKYDDQLKINNLLKQELENKEIDAVIIKQKSEQYCRSQLSYMEEIKKDYSVLEQKLKMSEKSSAIAKSKLSDLQQKYCRLTKECRQAQEMNQQLKKDSLKTGIDEKQSNYINRLKQENNQLKRELENANEELYRESQEKIKLKSEIRYGREGEISNAEYNKKTSEIKYLQKIIDDSINILGVKKQAKKSPSELLKFGIMELQRELSKTKSQVGQINEEMMTKNKKITILESQRNWAPSREQEQPFAKFRSKISKAGLYCDIMKQSKEEDKSILQSKDQNKGSKYNRL